MSGCATTVRAERAVVADDGRAITLTVYTGRAKVAVVDLNAAAAPRRLLGSPLEAASRRIGIG
jgi:hypothetical protein